MRRIALSAVFCVLIGCAAHGADIEMGGTMIKLVPPKGYCELTASQASDKRMIDFLNVALSKGPNELLAISADCTELRDWREGSRKLLEHFTQYQVEKVRRSSSFTIEEAKKTCEDMRAQGQKLSDDSTKNVNDNIHEANSKIDFQGQTFLGVLADDPNGCYVGLFQKYKSEVGTNIAQINVFFAGSIKEREVFFYVWTPYKDDSSATNLLRLVQSSIAVLKVANGL